MKSQEQKNNPLIPRERMIDIDKLRISFSKPRLILLKHVEMVFDKLGNDFNYDTTFPRVPNAIHNSKNCLILNGNSNPQGILSSMLKVNFNFELNEYSKKRILMAFRSLRYPKMLSALKLAPIKLSYKFRVAQDFLRGIKHLNSLENLQFEIIGLMLAKKLIRNRILKVLEYLNPRVLKIHLGVSGEESLLLDMNRAIKNLTNLEELSIEIPSQYTEKLSDVMSQISENLRGKLSIKKLFLSLKGCKNILSGSLPINLTGFERLESLLIDLSGVSEIDRTQIVEICSSLGNLTKLKTLNLNIAYKNLASEDISLLASSLKNLIEMQVLEFYCQNNHQEKDFSLLTASLACLKKLLRLTLNFSNCNFQKDSLKNLASTIKNLEMLRELKVYLENISNYDKADLDDFISSISGKSSLEVLALNLGHLEGFDKGKFSSSLKTLNSLRTIDLNISETQLNDKHMHSIAEAIYNMKGLQDVTLKFQKINDLTDQGIISLSKTLANFSALRSFSLHLNESKSITKVGLCLLMDSLSKNFDLNTLTFGFKKLGNLGLEFMKSFNRLIKKLKKLETISLDMKESSFSYNKEEFKETLRTLNGKKNLKDVKLDMRSYISPSDLFYRTKVVRSTFLRSFSFQLNEPLYE